MYMWKGKVMGNGWDWKDEKNIDKWRMRMAQGAKQGSAKKVGKKNIACSHFEWCVNSIEFNFQYVFCVVFSFVHTYVCYVHEYI